MKIKKNLDKVRIQEKLAATFHSQSGYYLTPKQCRVLSDVVHLFTQVKSPYVKD